MKTLARPLLVIVVVVIAAFGYVRLAERKGYALAEGVAAPAFRLKALDGGEVGLASLRGRVVVLNFWATWCPPCVGEMPSLERLHKALGQEGVAVVGVSVDEDEAALRRFVDQHKLTFALLRDPGGPTASGEYHATGYPETFVLDAQGVLREHYVGPADWATPEAIAHFRRLAKGSAR
jgi:peroxiredoxin